MIVAAIFTSVIILAGQSNMEGTGIEPLATITARVSESMVIQCARGGSRILDWLPSGSLYRDCLARVQAAGLPIRALFFSQGETEANPSPVGGSVPATEWGARFGEVVNAFRTDLQSPELPIMLARLGTTQLTTTFPDWATVRQQQEAAARSIEKVVLVNQDDVPLDADGLHHPTEGYQLIGNRMVDTLVQFEQAGSVGGLDD